MPRRRHESLGELISTATFFGVSVTLLIASADSFTMSNSFKGFGFAFAFALGAGVSSFLFTPPLYVSIGSAISVGIIGAGVTTGAGSGCTVWVGGGVVW